MFPMFSRFPAKNKRPTVRSASKESYKNTSSDSAPPYFGDSHRILYPMPKEASTGNPSFRRLSLSSAFLYACHIRQSTLERRNLYPCLFFCFTVT